MNIEQPEIKVEVKTHANEADLAKVAGEIGDLTKVNMCVAILVLLVNIILPGVGTMIAGCCIGGLFGKTFICTGVLQLITFPCIIGWVWAIYTGVFFIRVAINPNLIAEQMVKQMEMKM